MEEKELEELIQKETKELAEKQFLNGVLVGWNTCLFSIKKEISGMTSSRKIKKFIDKKIEESQKRINKEVENIKNESEENVNKKEIKCSHCHNEYIYEDEDLIDVDESHLGFICPECGNQIIVKEISYTDFPDSFYHYGEIEGSKKLTDKQIQNMVNSVVKELKEMKDSYGYSYIGTGDTIVFGTKEIDDGKNYYDIYVAKNYYTTSF